MRNVGIKYRVFFLGVATIVGMLVLFGLLLVGKSRIAAEMESLNRLARLGPTISALVHELQKERGASAGFIGSEGRKFAEKLAAQRKLTDEKRAALADAFAAFDAAAYGARLVAKVEDAEGALARIDDERSEVARLSVTVAQLVDFYTPTIAKLLGIVEAMAVLSTDARVGNAITAYISFLHAKERAGLERAMGSVGFGAGAFEPPIHRRFVQLVAMQETFLGVVGNYATDEQTEFYERTVTGAAVDEVERMRRVAIDYPVTGSTEGIDGAVWFDTITEKIDLLKTVEDKIAADLEALTAEIHGDARSAFTLMTVLVALMLTATITLSLVIARGITAPVKAMTEAMGRLAEGDQAFAVPATDRKDEIGEMAKAVQVFKDNITARKEAEEAVRKLSRAVEQSPASIVITDAEGTIEYVNPGFTEASGFGRGEALGKNTRILKSGRTPPEVYENLWGTIIGGGTWRGELLNKAKDGHLYWEQATISGLKDERGRITNFVAVKQDITEFKKAEETLRRSQKLEAIGQLTGGVAHDFNNLLGIIIGNLDLLEDEVAGNEVVQRQLAAALRSALRGADLTKRLLAFSNQSAGVASPIDISKVLVWMDTLLRRSLTAEVALEMELADELWLTEVDKGDFEDAIVNLAINARDAMPEGGRLVIETGNWVAEAGLTHGASDITPGDYVQVSVSDTGSGMSAATVEKIFEPFFTTKEAGRGTGLGLSMVYGFVKRSCGHIRVYSEPGYGTTFRIYLPRARKASDQVDVKETVSEELPRGDETILVVDDEEDMAAFVKAALEKLGYGVLAAGDAEEALRVLERTDGVELLLSDVVMPGGMSGFELAIAAKEKYPDLRILLGSGFTQRTQRSEKFPDLAKDMVAKPYRVSDLARRVRRALDEGRTSR
jgi:PAS domain S-box-containing protein